MIIEKETICLDLEGNNKLDLIDQLIEVAYQNNKITDKEIYKEAILKREEEFSTALGYLVAMPHGQSDVVNDPFVIFGRTKEELIWDKNPVRMIFMIGVPMKNRDVTHMKILANISRKLIDENFRLSLLNAQNKEEVFEILSEINEGKNEE